MICLQQLICAGYLGLLVRVACPLQRLHDPVFDDVQVPGHLPVLGAVNGHSLPQALGDTLLLNSNQTVPGAKDVEVNHAKF